MTSGEKILAGIVDEAKQKADEIIANAESDAKRLINDAVAAVDDDCRNVVAAAEQKARIIEATGRSTAEMCKRDKALKCRREEIDKTLNEVISEINSYDDKKYFGYLCSLIEKNVLRGKGILCLSKKDLSRDTEEFIKKLAGFNLTLSDAPAEINGGFILKYNDIQINGELKALVREKRELLVDRINTALFA